MNYYGKRMTYDQISAAAKMEERMVKNTIEDRAAEGYRLVSQIHDEFIFEKEAEPLSTYELKTKLLARRAQCPDPICRKAAPAASKS